jgi:hypothetical protein
VIQEVWQESLLPRVEEEVNGKVELGPPLDSSTIHWRPLEDGIVLLELFGGIGSGLVAVLQARLKVKRYIYVDVDEAARQVAKRHFLSYWPPVLSRLPSLHLPEKLL